MNILQFLSIPFKKYGRGFDGCDCWGLTMLASDKYLNMPIPDFAYNFEKKAEELKRLRKNFAQVKEAKAGAIALLTTGHVGLMIDNRNVLHTTYKTGSIIENVKEFKGVTYYEYNKV